MHACFVHSSWYVVDLALSALKKGHSNLLSRRHLAWLLVNQFRWHRVLSWIVWLKPAISLVSQFISKIGLQFWNFNPHFSPFSLHVNKNESNYVPGHGIILHLLHLIFSPLIALLCCLYTRHIELNIKNKQWSEKFVGKCKDVMCWKPKKECQPDSCCVKLIA